MVLQEDVRAALQEAPVCFLATCSDDVPNVVPVGYKWLVGNELLLADLFFDKTRRNLAANPAVAVTVAFANPKRGFQLKGIASVHRCGEPYERLRVLLRQKGVDAEPFAAVLISVAETYLLAPGPEAGKQVL